MIEYCRGCLVRYDDPMELLQYTEKYRRLFVYSTGLQVKRNGTIMFQLCKECFLSMKAACKFKKLCRTADKKLKSYIALKDVGNEVDFSTFLKNSESNNGFCLPICGNSTPLQNNHSKDDDNESTCTSIRNFMTDMLQGEEVLETEAGIIQEVIEEEADVLDDSLDSHWLQDDASVETDFRLDFSFSPFVTPHSIYNDHCYTPKRLDNSRGEQPKKYFTSISPARHHINDFTDVIRNNQIEKELCVLDNDEIHIDVPVSNYDMPIIENDDSAVNQVHLPNNDNKKSIINFGLPNIDNNVSFPDNDKSINSLNLPYFDGEKSLNNIDLCNLPSINNDQSMSNLTLPINDNEKSISSLDLPSFNSEKSITNLDLPSLPNTENEKSTNNLDFSKIDSNGTYNLRNNVPNFYVPTDGTVYITASNEIEKIVDAKKSKKDKPCSIDKNLEKALQNEKNQEFSLDDLLISPQTYVASGASTPTIANILFGKKVIENLEQNGHIDEILEDHVNKPVNEYTNSKDKKDNLKNTSDVDEIGSETRPSLYKFEYDEKQFDLVNFYCTICEKKYDSSRAIRNHVAKKHKIIIEKAKNVEKKPKMCSVCGKVFNNRQVLHRHMKIHNKIKSEENTIFKCDRCNLEFTSQAKLNKHRNSHENSVPVQKQPGKYMCTICGTTSTTIGNFRLHQRRHTKDYRFTCGLCHKGFYRLSDFTVHKRLHTGETPFACIHCDRKFKRKDALTKHVKFHLGERKFKCEHCSATFLGKNDLSLHLKVAKRCMRNRGILLDEKSKKITILSSTVLVKGKTTITDEVTMEVDEAGKVDENIDANVYEGVDANICESVVAIVNNTEYRDQLPYIETEMSN